jgi:hypothetical protein
MPGLFFLEPNMPKNFPSRPEVQAAAEAIVRDLPLPEGWPDRGVGIQLLHKVGKHWNSPLRKAGWPLVQWIGDLPQTASDYDPDRPRGTAVGKASQTCTVLPETWLRELCKRLNVPWNQVAARRLTK